MSEDDRPHVTVSWQGGVRFEAAVRGHRVLLDQPRDEGGTDEGMTPVEAMAVAVGSCVGYFVARFCQRHDLQPEALSVIVGWTYAERPHRVGALEVAIEYRGPLDDAMRDRLLKVAEGCTVHQTLAFPPEITVRLTTPEPVPDRPQGVRV
jgi:uncharacterized OsmC-like protein